MRPQNFIRMAKSGATSLYKIKVALLYFNNKIVNFMTKLKFKLRYIFFSYLCLTFVGYFLYKIKKSFYIKLFARCEFEAYTFMH